MRLRISHVLIALAALLIGFLLGLPHARAQMADGVAGRSAASTGAAFGLPDIPLAYRRS